MSDYSLPLFPCGKL